MDRRRLLAVRPRRGGRAWFLRLGFRTDLALSGAILPTLFLVGRALGHVVTSLETRRSMTSFAEPHLVYALPFSPPAS